MTKRGFEWTGLLNVNTTQAEPPNHINMRRIFGQSLFRWGVDSDIERTAVLQASPTSAATSARLLRSLLLANAGCATIIVAAAINAQAVDFPILIIILCSCNPCWKMNEL